MSAARLLKEARAAGLSISVSPAGKLACRGPAETVERLKPALSEHRDALLDELRAESAYDPARLQCEADRHSAEAAHAGLTDRFCRCRRLATFAWPDDDGREVWRCLECTPTRGRA
ncbi:hypothetical protein [Methylocystis sp.]|uniref:hypothetical protein n=1 Tax=Methylocystis sp. TaxID=1911079 RepID=UPI0025D6B1E9|nr:hypothetical protein [Methylocystis sp.]